MDDPVSDPLPTGARIRTDGRERSDGGERSNDGERSDEDLRSNDDGQSNDDGRSNDGEQSKGTERPNAGKHRSDGHRAGGDRRPVDGSEGATGTVRTNDVETFYVRRGDGPPIVFVHGMAMNATQWERQMEALGDDYTTIAYDVRGHGHTGGSDLESYSMELYASDLDALLSALDVERPILCGLSMGGCIVQAYAAANPGKVAGLVLADTFPTGPLPPNARLVFANLRFMARLDRVVRYTTLNRVQTWVGQRLAPGVAGDRATTQRIMEDAPTISHTEFAKIADSVARFPGSGLDVSRVTAPTLIVYGEDTPGVLRNVHARLAEQFAGAAVEVTVVPDAGHASNVDNPEFFSEAVRAFAREVFGKDAGGRGTSEAGGGGGKVAEEGVESAVEEEQGPRTGR